MAAAHGSQGRDNDLCTGMPDRNAERVASQWDENAGPWSAFVRGGHDLYRDLFTFPAMQAILPPIAGRELVDFGCGEGSNTRRFARMGAKMTGIDLSREMIRIASDAERAEPLGVDYRVASYCEDTGLPAASFDGVVSTMALMDGPGIEEAMREAYRLVRPGGFLAFSVLHPCFFTRGIKLLKTREGAVTALRVAGYFDDSPYRQAMPGLRWRQGDGEESDLVVMRYPRTIGAYCNAVAQAGFRIVRMDEPRPSPEACARAPAMAIWRDIGAFLLVLHAERPD